MKFPIGTGGTIEHCYPQIVDCWLTGIGEISPASTHLSIHRSLSIPLSIYPPFQHLHMAQSTNNHPLDKRVLHAAFQTQEPNARALRILILRPETPCLFLCFLVIGSLIYNKCPISSSCWCRLYYLDYFISLRSGSDVLGNWKGEACILE